MLTSYTLFHYPQSYHQFYYYLTSRTITFHRQYLLVILSLGDLNLRQFYIHWPNFHQPKYQQPSIHRTIHHSNQPNYIRQHLAYSKCRGKKTIHLPMHHASQQNFRQPNHSQNKKQTSLPITYQLIITITSQITIRLLHSLPNVSITN